MLQNIIRMLECALYQQLLMLYIFYLHFYMNIKFNLELSVDSHKIIVAN